MPKKRNVENENLPSRWRYTHEAYYYQVPPGLEAYWDFKQTYRLGKTFEEALDEFARKSNEVGPGQDIDLNTLLTHALVKTKAQPAVLSGVYFLLKQSEIVYVGRSDNIFDRISAHVVKGYIDFDGYHTVEAVGLTQARLEQLYIGKFRPKYNIRHSNNGL